MIEHSAWGGFLVIATGFVALIGVALICGFAVASFVGWLD